MSINQYLNGLNPLSYMGVNAQSPVNLTVRNQDPTTTDVKNFERGALWLNPDNNRMFQLISLVGNIAQWSGITYFVSRVVDPVGGDANYALGTLWLNTVTKNVFMLIATTGTPPTTGTWVLFMDATGPLLQLTTDDTTVVLPSAGNITIHGGNNITTTGSGSTVTISSSQSQFVSNYTLVNTSPYVVSATDYYLGVNCSGGAITVQLPNAPTANRTFIVKDITGSAATHNITVTTVGGAVTLDGATTFVMNTNYESANFAFVSPSYQIY